MILERFKPSSTNSSPSSTPQNGQIGGQIQYNNRSNSPCIAVHCVAGLGRAPVLVAIALIESGMKYEDAVEMIRGLGLSIYKYKCLTKSPFFSIDVRRGAINAKQLQYLAQYKPKKVLLPVVNGTSGKRKICCIV